MNSCVLQHVTFLVALISVIVAQTEFRRVCRSYQLDVGIRRWPGDNEATHTCVPGPRNGRCFIQGLCCLFTQEVFICFECFFLVIIQIQCLCLSIYYMTRLIEETVNTRFTIKHKFVLVTICNFFFIISNGRYNFCVHKLNNWLKYISK